jgi:hypothetical protein
MYVANSIDVFTHTKQLENYKLKIVWIIEFKRLVTFRDIQLNTRTFLNIIGDPMHYFGRSTNIRMDVNNPDEDILRALFGWVTSRTSITTKNLKDRDRTCFAS